MMALLCAVSYFNASLCPILLFVNANSSAVTPLSMNNLISFKASRLINVSLAATLFYDNDIPYVPTNEAQTDPGNGLGWWQVKQIFTIGFQYKFQ
jgi:hypothetical protein